MRFGIIIAEHATQYPSIVATIGEHNFVLNLGVETVHLGLGKTGLYPYIVEGCPHVRGGLYEGFHYIGKATEEMSQAGQAGRILN